MRQIIWWSLGFGAIWLAASGLLQYFAGKDNDLIGIANAFQSAGDQFWIFISPVLRFALLVIILLSVAEHFGLTPGGSSWQVVNANIGSFLKVFGTLDGIQAFIAVIVVGSLCISAIGGMGDTNTLKDLALVVVGFYFGSRKKSGDVVGDAGASRPTRPLTEVPNHPDPNSDPNQFPGFIGTADGP
jgi:hypothetical protein